MRVRYALLLAVFLAAGAAQGQTALSPGTPVSGTLATGDAHAYTLALDADQFVFGHADQKTADVVVTITGPDGAEIDEADVTARGPDLFQFESDAAGAYTITVTPFEDEEGDYALTVERVEPVATTPEGVVRQQFAAVDRDDSPGAVVAVVRGGELAFAETFGMADLTHGVPYTLETPTNIGSTSKQFTAFAIALLAERGELSLDDDVRAHVPELPDLGATVTLRHLLTHTSGYREFLNGLALSGRRGFDIERFEIIPLVQRQPELQNEPGAEFNYNNTAFALLATVVERVTGESFPDWMAANVFRPLGMTRTVVRADPTEIVPGRAMGYVPGEEGGWREAPDLGGAMGAGGMYSTAADLARWMANLGTGAVGGPDVIAQLTTRNVLAGGDTTDYGLGLFVDELRGLRRLHHGGADMAHRSRFDYFPDLDAGLIVHTNSPVVPGSGRAIVEAFFGEHLAPEPEADGAGAEPAEFDPDGFDPETFDAYAGRYEMDDAPGFILTFRRDGSDYSIQATGQPEIPIFPIGEARFEVRVVQAGVTFHVEDDGSVERITWHQNGDHGGTRLADEAAAVELADYVGRYYSDEFEAYYTIALADGELHLSNRRMERPVTLAHGTGESFTGGFPLAQVEFERDADGAVTGFRGGNGRTRDVHFAKVD